MAYNGEKDKLGFRFRIDFSFQAPALARMAIQSP